MEVALESVLQDHYLEPYRRAAREHGAEFPTLLWASPRTQAARFDAILRAYHPAGKSILDAGCGRADFLGFLLQREVEPAEYIGLEAVEALAAAAEARACPRGRIVRADFVRKPASLFVGSNVIVFSGSLNTMDDRTFYDVLAHACDAASEAVVFNFLNSPALAGKDYLSWRRAGHVRRFARARSDDVRVICDYLQGDCTMAIVKKGGSR